MNSRETESLVCDVLSDLGLKVRRLPERGDCVPDFAADDCDGHQYAIEVKTRHDSDDFRRQLAGRGLAQADVRLDSSSSVEADLRKAAKQLSAFAPREDVSRIVCCVMAGFSPSMQGEQIRATLFGTVSVNDVGDPTFVRPCFYLGRSFFRDHPEVGGVFFIDPSVGGGGLYPNAFSPQDVRRTQLGKRLAGMRAVFSPEEAATASEAHLIYDETPPAAEFKQRLRFVQRKYNRRLSPMRSVGWQAGFGIAPSADADGR